MTFHRCDICGKEMKNHTVVHDSDPDDYCYGEFKIELDIGFQGIYDAGFQEICNECAKKIRNIDVDDFKKFFIRTFMGKTEREDVEYDAEWKYWEGWCGNHDKRIDDATCSKCGYKHPTIRFGSPDLLQDYCPSCKSKMKKK